MTAPPSLEPPTYGPPPPPPPPGPPVRPPLRRSSTDKVIGGVSGGLAEYTGIDALLWRVGFVALAFAGGTGILVYLLLWLLMPSTPGGPAIAGAAIAKAPSGPRSPVPGVTIAALFIVVGLLALLARLTSWDPDPSVFLGTALLVVGLGLVAAALTGGRTAKGGLITLGIVLSLALLASVNAPWDGARGGVGDRTWAPTTADAVRSGYDGGVGDVELDLSMIDMGDLDEPVRTHLDNGIGDVAVVLPRDADVQVEVDSGLGNVDLLGAEDPDGDLYPGRGTGSWVDDGEPEIILTIDAGLGDVEVSRG